MAGDLVYFTIPAADTARARAFYGGLFGWAFAPGNVPDGYQITGPTPPGGLHGGGEGSQPDVFFGVEDLDAAVARVRELGGHADDPQETPSGAFALCRDDQGVRFGLWAPRAPG